MQTVEIPRDLLRKLIDDYEHCAPDADGEVSRWRLNLIKKVRELMASTAKKEKA